MSSALAITASTNVVQLDPTRHGETSFTVSNASGHQLRARVNLVPVAPAQVGWFSIVGDSERDYPINGTQQYTIKVAVPQDVATGRYTFRLDAINVANPDEDAVQGPAVALEVTSAPV